METRRNKLLKMVGYFCLSLVTVVGFITIVASGGGGGGGLKYDGITDPAIVDSGNAEDLMLGAYYGGEYVMNIASDITFGAVQAEEELILKRMNLYDLSKVMNRAVEKADIGSRIGTLSVGAVVTINQTIDGECGGNITIKGSVDDETGEFSGTVVFKNYCEYGMVMNGKVTLEGVMNLDSEDMESFEMTFTKLTETIDGYSIILDGSIGMETSGDTITNTLDLKMKSDGIVYWINNYVITVTEFETYITISVTGRYYDHFEGYVDITTDIPLLIYGDDFYPSSGVLIVTGDSSGARMEALNNETYEILVDTDGDGTYEYDAGEYYWDSYEISEVE